MPWQEIPSELVETFKPVTSLEDVKTNSEFYFCFRAAGTYSKVPAPKIKWGWITGDEFLEFIPEIGHCQTSWKHCRFKFQNLLFYYIYFERLDICRARERLETLVGNAQIHTHCLVRTSTCWAIESEGIGRARERLETVMRRSRKAANGTLIGGKQHSIQGSWWENLDIYLKTLFSFIFNWSATILCTPWFQVQRVVPWRGTSGSLIFMLRVKPCQHEIATDEIQEKNKYRECSNIKSARVSAMTAQWWAQCHAK